MANERGSAQLAARHWVSAGAQQAARYVWAAAHPTNAARLLPNLNGTYGYEVSQGGKPLIRQASILGQPGTRGFADPTRARRVAALVMRKLRHGLMPPTVTDAELDSLGATQ